MAKVTKLVIDIDGKLEDGKLALSVEEARNLKKLLDELFGGQEKITYIPYYTEPYRIYPYTVKIGDYPGWYGTSTVGVTTTVVTNPTYQSSDNVVVYCSKN